MNTITAVFGHDARRVTAPSLYQWDYGQVLTFDGLKLPDSYEVHFSNKPEGGQAEVRIGTADGVSIPDRSLESGEPVYAYVFLHSEQDDGETVYLVQIPVKKRPKPFYNKPTSVQQSEITEAIAALNAGVQAAESFAVEAEASAAVSAEQADNSAASAASSQAAQYEAETAADRAAAAADIAEEAERDAALSAQSALASANIAVSCLDDANASAEAAASSAAFAASVEENIGGIIADALSTAKESGDFKGDTGPVFTPVISSRGVISWTNNGGLENPDPIDLVTVVCSVLPMAGGVEF